MNITEETKRWPQHVSLEFYINENHEWMLVTPMINGQKEYTRIDKMTNTEIGDLVIKEIKECI